MLKERGVLRELAVGQEKLRHALECIRAEALGLVRRLEEARNEGAESVEVRGIAENGKFAAAKAPSGLEPLNE